MSRQELIEALLVAIIESDIDLNDIIIENKLNEHVQSYYQGDYDISFSEEIPDEVCMTIKRDLITSVRKAKGNMKFHGKIVRVDTHDGLCYTGTLFVGTFKHDCVYKLHTPDGEERYFKKNEIVITEYGSPFKSILD